MAKDFLKPIFDEAKTPRFLSAHDAMAQLGKILAHVTLAQQQIAEHRAKIFAAQSHTGEFDAVLERLHQTLNAWDKDAGALLDAAKRSRESALQYERYAAEIEDALRESGDQA